MALCSSASAGTFTAFGPKVYVRQDGRPEPVVTPFSVLNPNTQYTLKVESKRVDGHGDQHSDEDNSQTRARILINGKEIISFEDFSESDQHNSDDNRDGRDHTKVSSDLVVQKTVQLLQNNK